MLTAQEVAWDDGVRLARRLVKLLREPNCLPAIYPALFADGIDEGSLHSYMLSALVLVGDQLGFSPVSDSPIFDRLDKLLIGEGAKRPDAVWLARGQQEIRCLIEFERYTNHSLAPKAKNLLIMGKELRPAPHLVVLNYWTYSALSSEALRETRSIFATGFRHAAGLTFPPINCPALVLETLVTDQSGQTSIHTVSPRLFVCDGEDKPYIVQSLDAI